MITVKIIFAQIIRPTTILSSGGRDSVDQPGRALW